MPITIDYLRLLADQFNEGKDLEPQSWSTVMDPKVFADVKALMQHSIADWQVWWRRFLMRLIWGWNQSEIDAIKEILHRLETEEPIEITIDV